VSGKERRGDSGNPVFSFNQKVLSAMGVAGGTGIDKQRMQASIASRRMDERGELHTGIACQQQSRDNEQAGKPLRARMGL
jgi:hypothetical protein